MWTIVIALLTGAYISGGIAYARTWAVEQYEIRQREIEYTKRRNAMNRMEQITRRSMYGPDLDVTATGGWYFYVEPSYVKSEEDIKRQAFFKVFIWFFPVMGKAIKALPSVGGDLILKNRPQTKHELRMRITELEKWHERYQESNSKDEESHRDSWS